VSARVAVETALQISEGDSSTAVASLLELGIAQLSHNVRSQERYAIWDTFESWTTEEETSVPTLTDSSRTYQFRTIHFSVLTIDPKEAQA